MTIDELAQRVDELERIDQGDDQSITSITFDSRNVGKGVLFVALEGAQFDGHNFVDDAAKRGAAGVVVNRHRRSEFQPSCALLTAADTRATLGRLAACFYGNPSRDLRVVGVTGTNGKTTTTYLIEAILQSADEPTGVIGTIDCRWPGRRVTSVNTTPESGELQKFLAQMRSDRVSHVILEASSHGLALHRLRGTLFDVGVFTNLSHDHLDFHSNMRAYRDAKATLFVQHLVHAAEVGKRPVAVLNIDDSEGARLADVLQGTPVFVATYGMGGRGLVQCIDKRVSLDGTWLAIQVSAKGGWIDRDLRFDVTTALIGDFNVANILGAVGAALCLGVEVTAIQSGLSATAGVPGRLERVAGTGPAVFVDYAHTPDALRRSLETLRPHVAQRLIVVFGCGGDRDRQKRPLMGRVAVECADHVVLTSDNPRFEEPNGIISDVVDGLADSDWRESTNVRVEDAVVAVVDRAEAIRAAIVDASEDDVILIAGKGHEAYQEIRGVRCPFDDVLEVQRALHSAGWESV
jgi:UDP-N-acetylmuramyl-tripeptide synthetase